MFPLLPETAWLEFRGRPKKPGLNLTTHQALIVDDAGVQHKCFVKAAPGDSPMPYAEAIAWIIADALGLPRPRFAALVMLPLQKLQGQMPLDQHWLRYGQTVPAFCSSTVEGKHITSRWTWLSHLKASRAFKTADLPRIAAFDAWIENQDRHAGNFLRTNDGQFIPIDNEYVLYSLLWASIVNVSYQSLRDSARRILPGPAYERFESAMLAAAEKHQQALSSATPALKQFLGAVIADPATRSGLTAAVLQFLSDRSRAEWLPSHLGRIA